MKAEHMCHRQTHPTNPQSLLQRRSPQLQRGRWGGDLCEKIYDPRRNCKFKQIENHKKIIKNPYRCLDSQSHKHPSFHAPTIPEHHKSFNIIVMILSTIIIISYLENLKHCGFAKISSCLSNPALALPLLLTMGVNFFLLIPQFWWI